MTAEKSGGGVEMERSRARLSRVRITVRAMLLLVAACALAMLLYGEFKNGPPPRFIVRSQPARIA